MRQLHCIVVSTQGRAVEETAQEILEYYGEAFMHGEVGRPEADEAPRFTLPTHLRTRRHVPRQGD